MPAYRNHLAVQGLPISSDTLVYTGADGHVSTLPSKDYVDTQDTWHLSQAVKHTDETSLALQGQFESYVNTSVTQKVTEALHPLIPLPPSEASLGVFKIRVSDDGEPEKILTLVDQPYVDQSSNNAYLTSLVKAQEWDAYIQTVGYASSRALVRAQSIVNALHLRESEQNLTRKIDNDIGGLRSEIKNSWRIPTLNRVESWKVDVLDFIKHQGFKTKDYIDGEVEGALRYTDLSLSVWSQVERIWAETFVNVKTNSLEDELTNLIVKKVEDLHIWMEHEWQVPTLSRIHNWKIDVYDFVKSSFPTSGGGSITGIEGAVTGDVVDGKIRSSLNHLQELENDWLSFQWIQPGFFSGLKYVTARNRWFESIESLSGPESGSHLLKEFDFSTGCLSWRHKLAPFFEVDCRQKKWDFYGGSLENVMDPLNPQDVATKKYIDDQWDTEPFKAIARIQVENISQGRTWKGGFLYKMPYQDYWYVDKIYGNHPIAVSGNFISLARSGVMAGRYDGVSSVTVDTYGRVTHLSSGGEGNISEITGAVIGSVSGNLLPTKLALKQTLEGVPSSSYPQANGDLTLDFYLPLLSPESVSSRPQLERRPRLIASSFIGDKERQGDEEAWWAYPETAFMEIGLKNNRDNVEYVQHFTPKQRKTWWDSERGEYVFQDDQEELFSIQRVVETSRGDGVSRDSIIEYYHDDNRRVELKQGNVRCNQTPTHPHHVVNKAYVDQAGVLIGEVKIWFSNIIPAGFLLCDGRMLDRSDPIYQPLFEVIQDSVSFDYAVFWLPDFRDMFLRGCPASGRSLGSYQADDLKPHKHTHSVRSAGWGQTRKFVYDVVAVNKKRSAVIGVNGVTRGWSTSYTGNSETRPRNIAVNYIIRYK